MARIPQIRSGRLRFPIQIIQRSSQQDAAGGIVGGGAVVFATVWADIETTQGQEIYTALQMTEQITHKVTIRYMPGVRAKMDVVWNDGDLTHVYTIMDIQNPDGRPHVLYLMCLERDDSAYTVAGQ